MERRFLGRFFLENNNTSVCQLSSFFFWMNCEDVFCGSNLFRNVRHVHLCYAFVRFYIRFARQPDTRTLVPHKSAFWKGFIPPRNANEILGSGKTGSRTLSYGVHYEFLPNGLQKDAYYKIKQCSGSCTGPL